MCSKGIDFENALDVAAAVLTHRQMMSRETGLDGLK